MRISAQNKLCGTVKSISRGAIASQVVIQLKGTPKLTAVLTNEAADELELTEGTDACSVVNPFDVLVGLCQEGKCECRKSDTS